MLTKRNIESKLNHTIWTISTTVAAIVLAILTNSVPLQKISANDIIK